MAGRTDANINIGGQLDSSLQTALNELQSRLQAIQGAAANIEISGDATVGGIAAQGASPRGGAGQALGQALKSITPIRTSGGWRDRATGGVITRQTAEARLQVAQDVSFAAARMGRSDTQVLGQLQSSAEADLLKREKDAKYYNMSPEKYRAMRVSADIENVRVDRTREQERKYYGLTAEKYGSMRATADADNARFDRAQERDEQRMGRVQARAEQENEKYDRAQEREAQKREMAERRMQNMQDKALGEMQQALNPGAFERTTSWTHPSYEKTGKYTQGQLGAIGAWREDYLTRNAFTSVGGFGAWAGDVLTGFRKGHPYAANFLRGGMVAVGEGMMASSQIISQRTLEGRPNPYNEAMASGTAIGSLVGAALGTPFVPFGPIIGAHVGGTAGAALASMAASKEERDYRAVVGALGGGAGLAYSHGWYGMSTGQWAPGPTGMIGGGGTAGPFNVPTSVVMAGKISDWIGAADTEKPGLMGRLKAAYGPYARFMPNAQEVAGAASSIIHGLNEGGYDPDAIIGGAPEPSVRPFPQAPRVPRKGPDIIKNYAADAALGTAFYAGYKGLPMGQGRPQLVQDWYKYGEERKGWTDEKNAHDQWKAEPSETLWQHLTSNLAMRSGLSIEESGKRINPMLASTPEHGNNAADVLMKYGPTQTMDYWLAWTDPGVQPGVDFRDLRRVYSGVGFAERQGRISGYRARRSGLGRAEAYTQEMELIASLPGGRDSEAFAKAGANWRGAMMSAFDEQNIEQFGLADVRMSGIEQRMSIMPFAPGNMLAAGLTHAGMRSSHIRRLRGQMDSLRRANQLTPDAELQFTSQIEGLTTQNAMFLATAAEDMPNRLPALSAGGIGGSFNRFNTQTLAAMNLASIGHPGRLWGAASGRQARGQRDWLNQFDARVMGPGTAGSTGPLNASLSSERGMDDLRRIREAIEKLVSGAQTGGGFSRPSGAGGLRPGGGGNQQGEYGAN